MQYLCALTLIIFNYVIPGDLCLEYIWLLFSFFILLFSFFSITSSNTVFSVLFLVLAFFSSSLCLISFGIDFIGLMLMIVYVGAIAVLFLFVVMMLNLNEELYIYPLSFFHLLFKLIIYLFLNLTFSPLYSLFSYTYWYNTDKLDCVNCVGQILYGDLIFHFVGISVILMIAMVGAIALNFTPEKGFKGQDVIYQTSRSTELGLFVKFKNR